MTRQRSRKTNPSDEEGQGPVRLQAWLARAGVASRRAAERIILEGRVAVNGAVVTELGSKVSPGDTVALDGKPLSLEETKRYILLNKPAGRISAMADPEGRPLAVDLLKPAVAERVYNVGRLDQWSSGLLLFTNDGELAALLGHPSGGIEKEYEVRTDLDIPNTVFFSFERGVLVDGERYRAKSAVRTGPRSARIILVEGKNREIRRVLQSYGLRALALRRVRIGPLELGNLPEGGYRELSAEEVAALFAAAGKA